LIVGLSSETGASSSQGSEQRPGFVIHNHLGKKVQWKI
jgi:hypothetical protein